jgi:hypothetical protein
VKTFEADYRGFSPISFNRTNDASIDNLIHRQNQIYMDYLLKTIENNTPMDIISFK